MAIEQRIKEERERLGYSQAAFAAVAGKSLRSQTGWEQGRSAPDAKVLAAWAKVGADVLYIVTGQPSPPAHGDEAGLLLRYRAAPPPVRAAVAAALSTVVLPATTGVTVQGDVGAVHTAPVTQRDVTIHVGAGKKRGTRR